MASQRSSTTRIRNAAGRFAMESCELPMAEAYCLDTVANNVERVLGGKCLKALGKQLLQHSVTAICSKATVDVRNVLASVAHDASLHGKSWSC
jgi:hypothetical protein